ncbi:MAG: Wzt carbohydrate-binding domain-containing protein, partial [Anaerolineae bacterium]|nr:Wzt carbohydrate-binding domain-containing protein [Anaerolineae bacterium]
ANPEFGIGVNTVYGQRVFTVGTYFSRHRIDRIYGDVVITCEIEPPALAPGEYSIKVALGRGRFEPLEEVEDVARFSVKFTDFFGTGRLPQRNQGNVLVTSRWEISNV